MSSDQSRNYPVWTIPNTISFSRLTVLLPLSLGLLASGYYGWALVTLFFLGSSDALDGYLARKLNQVTPMGKELDPLSDRASILLVSVALVIGGLLPWYLFAPIVVVDLGLVIVSMLWFGGYPDLEVNYVGKVRTALLMLGLPGLILAAALQSKVLMSVALVITALGVLGHVVTGITYLLALIRKHRSDLKVGVTAV